jgi:hypothetical protein
LRRLESDASAEDAGLIAMDSLNSLEEAHHVDTLAIKYDDRSGDVTVGGVGDTDGPSPDSGTAP